MASWGLRVFRLHRPLGVLAGAMVLLAVACVFGLLLDDRTLVNAPLWAKSVSHLASFL
ncbi:hypothetical protein ATK30_1568 [Amycolatopsis echigonensis]|uniref:PepSY-associated transmembrane protein n=1 Tax=Amycolatopsis echigonensis TaxID=2576905 RepID=A0A2N3WAC2_9PSEU|nr:hypothetical protein [Amycolatopsis niigatensis]PKV90816.1 hypothetical protein ATK30_1568 [Amycolatopsis niigatensis]